MPDETWLTVSVVADSVSLSWTVKNRSTGAVLQTGSYIDPDPFTIKGNTTFHLISGGRDGMHSFFDNIRVLEYVPFLDGTEPQDVLYRNVVENKTADADNMIAFDEKPSVIRRALAAGFGGQKIRLSQDGVDFDELVLSQDGEWFNSENEKEYKYLQLPEGMSSSQILLLSDIKDGDEYIIKKGNSMHLYCSSNGSVAGAENFVGSNSAYASVSSETGEIVTYKEGKIAVSGAVNGKKYSIDVDIRGSMAEALEDPSFMPGFVLEQQEILDTLNDAILNQTEETSLSAVKAFLFGNGVNSYWSLDFVSYDLNDLIAGDREKDAMVKRIISYAQDDDFKTSGGFKLEKLDDMYDFEKQILREVCVGKVDEISDPVIMLEKLRNDSEYFKLPLETEYFTEQKDNILAFLLGRTFTNYQDLYTKFVTQMIMENLKNTISSSYLMQMLEDFDDFIGYNKQHYAEIKNTAVNELLNEKAKINDISEIKDFLDNYTPLQPAQPNIAVSSGRGGGKGGLSYTPSVAVEPEKLETAVEKKEIYPDVPVDFWGYEAIRYLSAKKVIAGYSDGSFLPQKNISRAEFLMILMKALQIEPKDLGDTEEFDEDSEIFSDLNKDDWYYTYIKTAGEIGLLKGSDGRCMPNELITKEEMAAFITRALNHDGKKLVRNTELMVFSDENDIADYALSSVTRLQAAGVIKGTDGQFMPKKNATRAEAAQIVYKTVYAIENDKNNVR